MVGLSMINNKCSQSDYRSSPILVLGNALPQFPPLPKKNLVGRLYEPSLQISFSPAKTNYFLFKYLSLDGITYYFQNLLCLYKKVTYFKVNTVLHIFLFSSASRSPQGFDSSCSLYQSFTIPLGTLLKKLLQMFHSEKKICVGFFLLIFHCGTSKCHTRLVSMNALGSFIVPMTKL